MKNYYDILEIHPKSSQEVIEASYKNKCKQYNPENFSTHQEILEAKINLNQVNEAYKILSNPKKRAKYDKIFEQKGGNVELSKTPETGLLVFFVIAVIIIILAEYIAKTFFSKFTALTVMISTTPILKFILFIILVAILIHYVWSLLKQKK